MDIDSYLKNHLNKDGQIKNKDLKELITQLKSKISSKLQDKKCRSLKTNNILKRHNLSC